jgi:hypothetical protein
LTPTVVFLWISAALGNQPAAPHGPDARERALLTDYGAARGLSFVPLAEAPPGVGRPQGSSLTDAGVVDELEAELEQARTAISALEEATAHARLTRIEATLLAHPHLPQAAFLLAECFALRAAASAHDAAVAARYRARRAALEGPRALSFGDTESGDRQAGARTVEIAGLSPGDELEVDGQPSSSRSVALAPGLHHVRVWRAGKVVLATFIELGAEQERLQLAVPVTLPCSADDLARVDATALAAGGAPPRGVACARFALARATTGGIEVAICTPEGCGPFIAWQARQRDAFRPLSSAAPRLPAWAGFAIAGATAVVATSLVLWQAGTFDQGRPAATRWEYGGINPQGLRF